MYIKHFIFIYKTVKLMLIDSLIQLNVRNMLEFSTTHPVISSGMTTTNLLGVTPLKKTA